MVDLLQQPTQSIDVPSGWLKPPTAALLLSAAVVTAAQAGPPAQAPPGSYARAHYDLRLVEECGLATAEVQRGFELARGTSPSTTWAVWLEVRSGGQCRSTDIGQARG